MITVAFFTLLLVASACVLSLLFAFLKVFLVAEFDPSLTAQSFSDNSYKIIENNLIGNGITIPGQVGFLHVIGNKLGQACPCHRLREV